MFGKNGFRARCEGKPVCFAALLLWAALSGSAPAVEPVNDFVEALRRADMHDLVEDYLDRVAKDPNIPAEIKVTIPFEIGRTLASQAAGTNDPVARFKLLDRAKIRFDEFVAAQPEHPLRVEAQRELGELLVQRAKGNIELSKLPKYADKKVEYLSEAKTLFAQAQLAYDAIKADKQASYEKIKGGEDKAARSKGLSELVQARLFAAVVYFQSAEVYPAGSDEHKAVMTEAAKRFDEIYTKFRKRLAGLYAGKYKADCLKELKDIKGAITIYRDLLGQPTEDPDFRELHNVVLANTLEIWTTDEKEMQIEEAANEGERWLKEARGDEESKPAGIAVKYHACVAFEKRIESLRAENQSAAADRLKKLMLDTLTELSKVRGDFQQRAKTLLAKFRRVEEGGEPETFDDAFTRAKGFMDSAEALSTNIAAAERTQDPATLPEVPKWKEDVAKLRHDAMKYFHLALRMQAGDGDGEVAENAEEVAQAKVEQAYYLLTYCYYAAGRYAEAAVLGEFLARKFPKASGARSAAMIALASHRLSHQASPPDQRKFEIDKLQGIALYIAKTWPEERDADQALMVLADISRATDIEEAVRYLERIPETSSLRAEAEMKAGHYLWIYFTSLAVKPEESRPDKEALQQIAARSLKFLEQGTTRFRGAALDASQATYALASSELSLAQAYSHLGQSDKAIATLERPDTGPLALVRAKSPAVTASADFPETTLRVALRTYVAAQQSEKAEGIMAELDALVANRPDAAAALTKIYVSLGRELEAQVKQLKEAGKQEELAKVLSAFEKFLAKIATGQVTFQTMTWVADSLTSLGDGLKQADTTPPEAKRYYDMALATYQIMLDRIAANPEFAPPNAISGVVFRMARCQRMAGNYDKAMEFITTMLKSNPNVIDAQKEAAWIFMAQGAEKPESYGKAIAGAFPQNDNKNLVWGWGKMAVMVQRNPQYRPVFFESRYYVSDCLKRLALTKQGDERTKQLTRAETELRKTWQLSNELGSPEQKQQYDRLLKEIQGALGKQAVGLKAFEAAPAAAATTSAAVKQ